MVNLLKNSLFRLKKRNFGLGLLKIDCVSKNFGFPACWKSNIPYSTAFAFTFAFNLRKAEGELNNIIMSNSYNYNSSLRKFLLKKVRILKVNRTLRGVRHAQFLPVRNQRTKTNAKTQKRKRN